MSPASPHQTTMMTIADWNTDIHFCIIFLYLTIIIIVCLDVGSIV